MLYIVYHSISNHRMAKLRGYIEWVSKNPDIRIGFITNPFGRILYINSDWPDGNYEKMCKGTSNKLVKILKNQCVKGRDFNKDELMLELL